ncbi:cell division protein ZapA [Sphingopyxis indica]|uniref:cell division protein ZapA n=1 Tax=Sphingopyxis indica TaxID=436663 RepID=UPI002939484C|nr:cell division protein ZapA [Sphingopyxis indica]WOF41834.1 cell division protein ZapA [Sphingopyxis indica]
MADVHLNIAGRSYDVHCADGQEEQLRQLAAMVDEKARGMTGSTEVRQLLFAALMLADEASEARGKVEKAEPESDSLRAAVALAESRAAAAQDELKAAQLREKRALHDAKVAAQREESALAELEKLRQGAPVAPPAPAGRHDRALMQIADRIEALASTVEQMA